jgi:hypothetical protein
MEQKMKKSVGAIITLALLSAALYLGVIYASKSKSRLLLAEYLQGFDNWSVESTYYNPFTPLL